MNKLFIHLQKKHKFNEKNHLTIITRSIQKKNGNYN